MDKNTAENKNESLENTNFEISDTKTENTENEQAVGYPDISKVNTKFVVIGSLICIVAIFLLSILFPSDKNTETDKTSTETVVTTEASSN